MTLRNLSALSTLALALGLAVAACDDGGSGTTDTTSDTDVSTLPSQVSCSGSTCRVEASLTNPITQSFRMTADKEWLLVGGVFIGDDTSETVLTIDPGTTIYGEAATTGFLTIRRGSKIMAEGRADAPIVFTSSKAVGSRARGDWGGIIINGRAPVNGCATAPCEAQGEGGSGTYGGADPLDDSGTLKYVRVEFAGHQITETNEFNAIAFQGVGSGTEVDYLHLHMAADDGIEFFGGTVSVKHILATGGDDDNLDWTGGWSGRAQFVVVQQYDDAGDNGIEADNNANDNEALPRSHPVLANVTLIGSPDSSKSDDGMLLREGTAANISNAIVMGWNEACLDIDHAETFKIAKNGTALSGDLTISGTIFSCATNFLMDDEEDADKQPITDPWSVSDFVMTLNTGNRTVDPGLTAPLDLAAPDFRPAAGSPAASGAVAVSDPWFTATTYVGGVDPADDWTTGWTTFERN
ncbi:MAG: hypothetical protein H6744_02445 [Deltaproteobacteria bacterium]|nr:hypothetical protein [Deltaproteobacteria bacterium]